MTALQAICQALQACSLYSKIVAPLHGGIMASPLGDKIRARRTELGLSLEQLAKATDSSKGYLWELENRDNANPSADKLIRIAKALSVTTEFLLDRSTDVAPEDGIIDEAFFRRYKGLDPKSKEKIRRFLDMWDDED